MEYANQQCWGVVGTGLFSRESWEKWEIVAGPSDLRAWVFILLHVNFEGVPINAHITQTWFPCGEWGTAYPPNDPSPNDPSTNDFYLTFVISNRASVTSLHTFTITVVKHGEIRLLILIVIAMVCEPSTFKYWRTYSHRMLDGNLGISWRLAAGFLTWDNLLNITEAEL